MDDKIKNIFKRLLTVIILILMIQIIPIYAIKFPDWLFPQATKLGLNLGTIKQDNNLTADEDAIIVDENGKKYIVWTYTSKITKDKSAGVQREEPKDPKLERYFVTTKDSGLGEPEIISVTKDGQILETPYTFGSGNPDKFLSKKELVDLRENDKYGTYIYKIKTPILGYRDHYALDVNSVLTGVFGKNVTVNIGGIKRKLKKEETISVSVPQRLSISRNAYAQLKQEDRNDKVNIATSFDKFKNTAGEYLNEDRIVWRSSYLNQYSYKEAVEFDLTPDDSQLPMGDLKVYYFKPGENGYEIVESMTKIFKGETKAVIDDVPQGFIAQAVLEASVKDDGESKYKNHSLKNTEGVQLESLFAKLTIEKKWGTGVTEDQKSDTNYTISGGMYDNLRVTIPKGQSFNIINNVAKFNINAYLPLEQWDRIYYNVEEEQHGHFRLIFKGENKYTLKYTFKNDVESTTNPGSGESGGECSAYGVESLQTVEINQYWYEYKDDYSKSKKSKWYGFGGDLSGVLRVPKTADAGQSITLKLPDEIKFEHAVNDIPIIGFSRSSSSGGSVEIGKIYYESGNTLRFVFNKFAKADADYTVNFTLGQSVGEGQGLKEINGTSVNDYEFGKRWPVGIEPNLSRFYPDNPQTMETVTKTLPYISKYHNFKDTEECAEKVLGVETTVHYEDEKIAGFCKHLSKYVAEEGSDYIIWEAVYNARNDNLRGGEIDFYDFLGVTNELYDGNNQEALPKDIEMYVADHGTVSGSYVKGTERQIYPRGGYAQVKGEKHNGKIDKSNLKKIYQLSFRVRDLGSQTLVVRIKTKKLAPLPDGDPNNPNTKKYYYNSIQSQQSARDKDNVVTLRYAPKLGRASGIAQGIYNFSFQKTELVKGNDGQEKEVPLRNSSCEFMAIRTDGTQNVKAVADKNGKVVFENLKDGEFIVQEIKPPNGYETYHEEFRFKITIDHVAGETAEIQKKVEYKKGHGNWQIWDPNNLPTIPNNISPNLKIKKLDAITGKQIEGAHFQLIKNKVGDESEYDQTIDEEGISEFVFSYLTPGVYTLKETKAPEGYEKADDIYINVENINGKTYIYHRSWLGDLNPRELDKEDGCYIFRLPNRKRSEIRIKKFDIYGNIINDNEQKAKFDLYAEDTGKSENEVAGFDFSVIKENSDPRYAKKEYVFEDGSKMNARLADKVFVTKAAEGLALDWAETPTKYLTNGEIEYKDLPDGNYFIMEAEAPSGYEKLKFPIPFIIENGRLKGSFSGYLPIVNIKKGEFYIEKVDKSDNKLEGVEFTLFEKNDKGEKAQQIEQKTTDANGLIKFDNLESGQYILEETKTINDYEIEGPFDISVDKYGRVSVLDSDGQNLVVLRKLNESDNEKKPVIKIVNSKKYNLIIRKRDKLQVEKFMSSSGDILSEEDKKALKEWEDNNNKEKKLIEDLKNFGVIDEKKAKENYEKWLIENPKPDISLNPQDFDADKKPTDTASEKFRVLKAKFELLDENQESFTPAKIGETNTGKKEGILRFDNLRTGIYYLKELEAPEGGYLGIRGAYKFEITDNGEIISLENKSAVVDKLLNNDKDLNLIIKNKKVKYGIRIKKIDYNNGATLGGNIIKTPARFRILDEHKKEVAGEVANLSDGDYRFINGGKYYKPGIYYIKEEKAPVLSDGSSFSMLSPNPFGIRLKGDGSIEVLDDSLEDMISFEGLEEAKTRNVSYRSVSVQDDEEDSSDEEENLEDEYFDSSSEIEKENLNEDLDDNSKENSDKNEDSKIENQDFLGIINKKLEESDKLIQNSEKLSELNNNQNIGSNEEGESKNKENKALPDLSEAKGSDEIQKENKITMTPRALDNEDSEAKMSLENSDKEAKIDKKDESLVKISEENETVKNKGIFKNILDFYKIIKNNENNKLEDLERSVRSLAADTDTAEDEALFDGISTIKISNANTKKLRLSKRVKQTNQAINEGEVTFKLKKDTSKKYIIKKFKVNEEIVFNNLLPGNYTLEEIDAPLGYVKEKIKYKLVVDSQGAKLYEDNTKEDLSYQKGMKIIKSEHFNNPKRSNPESYALDNDENTYAIWERFQGRTNRLPVGAYLGVDLGALKNISYILINQGHPGNINDRFKNFVLEYSSDGINYTIFKEYEESEGSGIAHLNMNIDARYIRLRNLKEISDTWIGIQDFIIYAKPYNEIQNESGLYLIGNRQNPNINLVKVDKSGNEINGNGAKFELRKVDDTLNSNENLNADSGELASKIEIGNKGSVFIDKNNTPLSDNKLPLSEYGKYILVEKQAPNGYRLLDKPILLELSEDINDESKTKLSIVDDYSKKFANIENVANNTIRLKIKNFKEGSGEFAISKRIKGIENIKNLIDKELSFRLSKDNDNSFVPIEKKAKANTNIIFDGLKDGVYTLEELNPPEGYVKEKKNYKVVVSNSGKVEVFDLDNISKNSDKKIQLSVSNLLESEQLKKANMSGARTRDKIFDSNNDTVAQYVLNGSVINEGTYIGVDLCGYYDISQIKFVQDPTGKGGNDKFDKLVLESSIDGINYKELKRYNDSPKIIELTKLSEKARFIRIRNLEKAGGRWFMLNTIDISGKSLAIKTIEDSINQDINVEENLVKIGNIQNPKLDLIKTDENGNIITNNNADGFTAKFKLYKIDDNKSTLSNEEKKALEKGVLPNGFKEIQEFTLKGGKLLNVIQKASELGRYLLFETNAPQDYIKAKPIFMDLIETRQNHSASQKKATSCWKLLEDTTKYPIEDAYPKFSGEKEFKDLKIDYKSLAQNKLILKIKNKKMPKGAFSLYKKVETNATPVIFKESDNLKIAFKLTKDDDKGFLMESGVKGAHEKIEFNNLSHGVYSLEETLAPEGYIKKLKPYKVYVDECGNTAIVENIEGLEQNNKIPLTANNLILSERFKNRPLQYGSYNNIFDGNENSGVQINMDGNKINADDYIGVDLKGLYKISNIRFCQAPKPSETIAGNDAFDDMLIEYSIDGKTFYAYPQEFINENKPERPNTNANTEITDQNIVARFIRFRSTQDSTTRRWFIAREITIKGAKIGDEYTVANEKRYTNLLKYVEFGKKDKDIADIPNMQNPHLDLQKVDKNGNLISSNNRDKAYNAKFKIYKIDDNKTELTATEVEKLLKTEAIQEFVLKNGKLAENSYVKNQFEQRNIGGKNLNVINQKMSILGRYALIEEEAPDGYEVSKPILLDLVKTKIKISMALPDYYIISSTWKLLDDKTKPDSKGFYKLDNQDNENISIDYSAMDIIDPIKRKGTITIKVKNDKQKARLAISKRIKGIEDVKNFANDKKVKFKLSNDASNTYTYSQEKEAPLSENIIFDNLLEGLYTLKEVKAPEGYVKDDDYKIYIDKNLNINLYRDIDGENEKSLGTSEITIDKTITGSFENQNAIIDGNEDTQGIIKPNNSTVLSGQYLELRLNDVYKLSSLKLIQDKNGRGGNDAFDKFSIEYSIDGINFEEYKIYENANKPNKPNTILNINEEKLDIFAKAIRFKSLETSGSRWLRINEISLRGRRVKDLQSLNYENQKLDKINLEENLLKIGNIQNPKILLEKIDKKTEALISDNIKAKDYNAKFTLYKLLKQNIKLDKQSDFTNTDNFEEVQKFTLKSGKLEENEGQIQKADSLGRYVLVETETPDGYVECDPIELELVETIQSYNSNKKHITSWKLKDDKFDKEEGFEKFIGQKNNEAVIFDYSELANDKIKLRIKNEKGAKKLKIKIVKVDNDNKPIKGNESTSARFFISKDGINIFNGQIANLKSGYYEFDNKRQDFEPGLYYLVEERAPKSHVKLSKPIPFYIEKNGNLIIPAKSVTGSDDKYEQDTKFVYKNLIKVEQAGQTNMVIITITNTKSIFSNTGGMGSTIFYVLGLFIMTLSGYFLKKRYEGGIV